MNRYVVWTLLSLLVAAHASVDMLLNQIGISMDMSSVHWSRIVRFATFGVFLSQPALLAVVAVLWPAHWAMRLFASVGLLLLMVYSMLLGGASSGDGDLSVVVGPGLLFLVIALVLWAVSRLRRWRIVAWPTWDAFPARRQFSVRGLLLVIAIASVLFALGRLILPATVRLDPAIDWSIWLAYVFGFGLAYAVLLSPMLPALPLMLAIDSRGRFLLPTVLATGVVPLGLLFVIAVPMGEKLDAATMISVCGPAIGAFGSIILSLLVLRWCGFRLVREGRRDPSAEAPLVDRSKTDTEQSA